jgi:hypothetical protein
MSKAEREALRKAERVAGPKVMKDIIEAERREAAGGEAAGGEAERELEASPQAGSP